MSAQRYWTVQLSFPSSVLLALVMGLIVGAFSGDAAARFGLAGLPDTFQARHYGGLLYTVSEGLVVYACIQSPWARRFFVQRWAVSWGAISFPNY